MVITEAELRQMWQNGRGQIPAFAPGTRFTPAALDFLRAQSLQDHVTLPAEQPSAVSRASGAPDQLELRAPAGQRLIYTSYEVDELLRSGAKRLVVHPSVTVTDSAREKLRAAGVRIIPFVEENTPPAPVEPSDEELFRTVKRLVLARMGAAAVDEHVLDTVLRRVLAETPRR